MIGCSYRQLDYLTRFGITPEHSGRSNPGSGARRLWSHAQVARLALAYHLAHVVPDGSFPELAVAAMHPTVPDPPLQGYALYTTGPTEVRWVATWTDVRDIIDDWGAAAIARYDLVDLLGGRVDVDQLVA